MRSFPVPGNWGMHAERNPVYATYENILFIMYKKPSEQSTPAVFYNLNIEEIKKICYNRTETWIYYTEKRGEA